jgi:hypothetical protein
VYDLPQAQPEDSAIIALFRARDGAATEVTLAGGRVLTVVNIAWGYDAGDTHAHVTTNISPEVRGAIIDFFFTSEIVRVTDPLTGVVLV